MVCFGTGRLQWWRRLTRAAAVVLAPYRLVPGQRKAFLPCMTLHCVERHNGLGLLRGEGGGGVIIKMDRTSDHLLRPWTWILTAAIDGSVF